MSLKKKTTKHGIRNYKLCKCLFCQILVKHCKSTEAGLNVLQVCVDIAKDIAVDDG